MLKQHACAKIAHGLFWASKCVLKQNDLAESVGIVIHEINDWSSGSDTITEI